MDATDVLKKVSQIKAPICAVVGTKDTIVTPKSATDIFYASTNKNSKKYIIENADHIFNLYSEDKTAYQELCKQTISWFEETL